jgi:heme exporter protein D
MMFDSFSAFIHMDGHGAFVWSAYGFALAVFVYNVVAPLRIRRKVVRENQHRMARENS